MKKYIWSRYCTATQYTKNKLREEIACGILFAVILLTIVALIILLG